MQRRPVILLELLIGFVLAAILLSFLFSSFRHVADLGQKVHKAKTVLHQRAITKLRLTQLFAHLQLEEDKSFYFAPHEESFSDALFFKTDHGLDPNPDFCGPLKVAIYLNKKKELCLCLAAKTTKRTEVLLKGAETLSFSFFNEETKEWEPTWEADHFPSLFKLQVNKEVTFAFMLPDASPA